MSDALIASCCVQNVIADLDLVQGAIPGRLRPMFVLRNNVGRGWRIMSPEGNRLQL